MTNDLFTASETPPVSGVEDLLAQIKNEQGEPKYKTVEDAIKGLSASQNFIATLLNEKKEVEARLAEQTEKANKQTNIEDVLAKLAAQKEAGTDDQPKGGLSADQVAELVRNELSGLRQKDAFDQNLSEVQASLNKKFGDKAREAIAKKAQELGTTPEKLGELSQQNPKLVLALFGAEKAAPTQIVTNGFNLPASSAPSELEPPTKSLLLGATTREQKAYMAQVKADVYKRFNVET